MWDFVGLAEALTAWKMRHEMALPADGLGKVASTEVVYGQSVVLPCEP